MRRILLGLLILIGLLAGGLVVADRYFPEQAAHWGLLAERSRSGLTQKSLTIPGYEVAYLEGGSGEPLVLVHGIGADKDNFTRVARWLTPHYRVIAIDLPGFGDSTKPPLDDYSIGAQVARLDQILAALKLPRAHLGGSSMGGWIVGRYAAEHPDKTASLWLLAPAGVEGGKESPVRKAYLERGEYLLMSQKPEDFERTIATVFVTQPWVPYSVRQVLARKAVDNYVLHTRIFRETTANWERDKLNDKIAGSNVPALIVWGDKDYALDVSAAPILAALMPKAQVEIMQDIGHLPMMETPRIAAERYNAFRQSIAK